MNFRVILYRKNFKFFAIIILSVILIYSILRLLVFESDPVIQLITALSDSYLLLAERLANMFLHWMGDPVIIKNHVVLLNKIPVQDFLPEIRYKKILFFILLLVWLTKTSIWKRSLFTILSLVVHLAVISSYIAVGADLVTFDYYDQSVLAIPNTFALLCLFTLLFVWFFFYKGLILESLTKIRVNTEFINKKASTIAFLIIFYIIVIHFFREYYDFEFWINFLFTSAQKILDVFGYEAEVKPFHLVGSNGSIYMAKYCLGFQTMFLFASIIYLTGKNDKARWVYIFGGLVFLNFVNIMRFVFLFIHIQRNGGYTLAMDLHDMYNYITYSIVFILWVIWFETYSDIRKRNAEKDISKKFNKI